jgi:hypothetical protein
MTNLSRRALVTSGAALPALVVPALASFSPDHPDAELLRFAVQLEAVGQQVEAENELAANCDEIKLGQLVDRLNPLANEILAMQPTTLDGLRVQARALALRAPDLWDVNQEAERDFMGAVFTLLGVGRSGKPVTA